MRILSEMMHTKTLLKRMIEKDSICQQDQRRTPSVSDHHLELANIS